MSGMTDMMKSRSEEYLYNKFSKSDQDYVNNCLQL